MIDVRASGEGVADDVAPRSRQSDDLRSRAVLKSVALDGGDAVGDDQILNPVALEGVLDDGRQSAVCRPSNIADRVLHETFCPNFSKVRRQNNSV